MPYVFHLQVNGTKGTIRNNGFHSETFPGHENEWIKLSAQYPDDWNVAGHPFPEEISYFVDCVVENKESMVSIPRAYKTSELVFAAELAAREGRVVKLPLD
jgi:predicted dehydrogenase